MVQEGRILFWHYGSITSRNVFFLVLSLNFSNGSRRVGELFVYYVSKNGFMLLGRSFRMAQSKDVLVRPSVSLSVLCDLICQVFWSSVQIPVGYSLSEAGAPPAERVNRLHELEEVGSDSTDFIEPG